MRIWRHIPGVVLCLALLFWAKTDPTWEEQWVERWGVLFLFIGIFSISALRIRPLYRVALGYLLVTGCVSGYLSFFHGLDPEVFHPVTVYWQLVLKQASVDQVLALFSFVLMLALPSFEMGLKIASYVVLAGIVFAPHPTILVPYLHNPSMAATFVTLASGLNPILALTAIFLTHSWTAFITWVVGVTWILRRHFSRYDFLGVAVCVGAWIHLKGIPDNGRFSHWVDHYQWFLAHTWPKIWMGMGLGTGTPYMMKWALEHPVGHIADVRLFLHNDWLQAFIDLGGMGFLVMCLSSICLFKDAGEKDRGILLALGVSMLSNFPLHWPITALVAWTLVKRITESGSNSDRSPLYQPYHSLS